MIRYKMTTDFSNFKQGIIEVIAKVESASRRGMEKAQVAFMNDCLHVPPACPRRSGSMAASHSVFVDGKLVKTSKHEPIVPVPGYAATGATPLTVFPKTAGALMGTLVVHKPYAAAVHEGITSKGAIRRYTSPETGKKWVESKVLMFAQKYLSLIAGTIRSVR